MVLSTRVGRRRDQGPVLPKMVKFYTGLRQIFLAKFSSCAGTCNWSLQNVAEPLLQDSVLITHKMIV